MTVEERLTSVVVVRHLLENEDCVDSESHELLAHSAAKVEAATRNQCKADAHYTVFLLEIFVEMIRFGLLDILAVYRTSLETEYSL